MTDRNLTKRNHRHGSFLLELYRNPILLVIVISVLPTIVLLDISYFQAISYAKANLERIITKATIKTDRLLKDADVILHRSKIDLQNADTQTSVKILQRLIYNDFRFLIEKLKAANDLDPTMITFEITENKLIEKEGQTVQDAIARLKMWGVSFAIDDFGTGYSNIGYLQRLDIDRLKLNRLFINGLQHGNNMVQIVDSLIDLGNRMGLTIIAEGIETETQYEYLRARGVHSGQGWLFSRPMPYEDFERFLQAQNT